MTWFIARKKKIDDKSLFITKSRSTEFMLAYDNKSYNKFKQEFDTWIHSSSHPVRGLPGPGYITNGITEALDQTYALYRKIGIFKGEYGYHDLILDKTRRLTTSLRSADCIIVSHPFAADGMSAHEKLAYADTFNKPIFVDCAFFGVCSNIDFDFTPYKNIHSVAFSLSKVLGTGWHRVGMLYTKDRYPVTITDNWNYQVISSVENHVNVLSKISPDDIPNYYKSSQLDICKRNGLTPSDTVIFGLEPSNKYRNGTKINRICISKILELENKSLLLLKKLPKARLA
tara:strand:+ start:3020 stop:3877 length:858 start_codon:yes stop_codon:yes gene_type:complete